MDGDTTKKKKNQKNVVVKKAISLETFVFLGIFFLIFGLMARKMGTPLMFKTMMATAHDLLLNTVFFIMAMAVIAGAISETTLGNAWSKCYRCGGYIFIR